MVLLAPDWIQRLSHSGKLSPVREILALSKNRK